MIVKYILLMRSRFLSKKFVKCYLSRVDKHLNKVFKGQLKGCFPNLTRHMCP